MDLLLSSNEIFKLLSNPQLDGPILPKIPLPPFFQRGEFPS
jgi:hypothetical protein